ncbi:MAG: tyrosine--tRNA ligase [Chlamydiae bacterium]|nr:tyrosine--tRNA ligase [Chlamydiota bacterium]
MSNVIDCLRSRGLIDAISSDELHKRADTPLKAYVGFDPTADSLHLGNLLGIVVLRWFQKFGHTPVVILGGATGRIGDPSGKSKERPFLDEATIEHNITQIRKNFERVLDFACPNAPIMLNNDMWFSSFKLIDFLRDIGKHFRLGSMLAKDSVKTRVQSEEGMSFTEFSYQMLQGYDAYHLFSSYDVCLQMGGSDQWGNITAGTDLIRKLTGKSGFGMTFPLLTRADGKKFGKSEEGAIWLSEEKCSPYQFYQYLIKVADSDVIKMLRMLTFLDLEAIQEIEESMSHPGYVPNTAQKRLAEELTHLVHGKEGLEKALRVTEGAAPGAKGSTLDIEVLQEIAQDMPNISLPRENVLGHKFTDVAALSGIVASKGEATRLVAGGGAYLNNEKIDDPALKIDEDHLIGGQFLLLGMGKKKKILVKVQP